MRKDVEHRIEALEEKAKPPMISTLADFVKWCADHEDDDEEMPELSPELEALAKLAAKDEEGDTN